LGGCTALGGVVHSDERVLGGTMTLGDSASGMAELFTVAEGDVPPAVGDACPRWV